MKKSYPALIVCLVLAVILVSPGVSMAFDLFVRVAGVDGESDDDTYGNWIEGLSFASGIISDGSRGCFNDIEITKEYDRSSPTLSLYAAMGTHVQDVQINFVESGGDRRKFLEILLTGVTVTSVSSGGSAIGEQGRPHESVAFSFNKIEWKYTLLPVGGGGGGTVEEEVDPVTRCGSPPPK